jgi:hypothetical protein
MKKLVVFLMVVGLVIGGSGLASADLLIDRGLPTSNLNNAAGSSRSNVAWADWENSNTPTEYWVNGDDVVLTNPGAYHIDTVRVWTTSSTGLSLLAGSSLSNAGTFSSYTSTPVTYSNGSDYQGNTNTYQLYQLDFAINEDVTSGKYYFFLDGPWVSYYSGGYTNAFIHASNAALSGSPQQGADDVIQQLHIINGSVVGVDPWISTSGGAWDKTSDANVQVFGTQVPEPATMLLLGLGLVGIAGIRRKMRI